MRGVKQVGRVWRSISGQAIERRQNGWATRETRKHLCIGIQRSARVTDTRWPWRKLCPGCPMFRLELACCCDVVF